MRVVDAEVWVVAGCLFEVVLPVDPVSPWRWANGGPEVTMLASDVRATGHHLRFRAEAAGAAARQVVLRFEAGDGLDGSVVVRVAPEEPPET